MPRQKRNRSKISGGDNSEKNPPTKKRKINPDEPLTEDECKAICENFLQNIDVNLIAFQIKINQELKDKKYNKGEINKALTNISKNDQVKLLLHEVKSKDRYLLDGMVKKWDNLYLGTLLPYCKEIIRLIHGDKNGIKVESDLSTVNIFNNYVREKLTDKELAICQTISLFIEWLISLLYCKDEALKKYFSVFIGEINDKKANDNVIRYCIPGVSLCVVNSFPKKNRVFEIQHEYAQYITTKSIALSLNNEIHNLELIKWLLGTPRAYLNDDFYKATLGEVSPENILDMCNGWRDYLYKRIKDELYTLSSGLNRKYREKKRDGEAFLGGTDINGIVSPILLLRAISNDKKLYVKEDYFIKVTNAYDDDSDDEYALKDSELRPPREIINKVLGEVLKDIKSQNYLVEKEDSLTFDNLFFKNNNNSDDDNDIEMANSNSSNNDKEEKDGKEEKSDDPLVDFLQENSIEDERDNGLLFLSLFFTEVGHRRLWLISHINRSFNGSNGISRDNQIVTFLNNFIDIEKFNSKFLITKEHKDLVIEKLVVCYREINLNSILEAVVTGQEVTDNLLNSMQRENLLNTALTAFKFLMAFGRRIHHERLYNDVFLRKPELYSLAWSENNRYKMFKKNNVFNLIRNADVFEIVENFLKDKSPRFLKALFDFGGFGLYEVPKSLYYSPFMVHSYRGQDKNFTLEDALTVLLMKSCLRESDAMQLKYYSVFKRLTLISSHQILGGSDNVLDFYENQVIKFLKNLFVIGKMKLFYLVWQEADEIIRKKTALSLCCLNDFINYFTVDYLIKKGRKIKLLMLDILAFSREKKPLSFLSGRFLEDDEVTQFIDDTQNLERLFGYISHPKPDQKKLFNLADKIKNKHLLLYVRSKQGYCFLGWVLNKCFLVNNNTNQNNDITHSFLLKSISTKEDEDNKKLSLTRIYNKTDSEWHKLKVELVKKDNLALLKLFSALELDELGGMLPNINASTDGVLSNHGIEVRVSPNNLLFYALQNNSLQSFKYLLNQEDSFSCVESIDNLMQISSELIRYSREDIYISDYSIGELAATPLHLAIMKEDSDAVDIFLQFYKSKNQRYPLEEYLKLGPNPDYMLGFDVPIEYFVNALILAAYFKTNEILNAILTALPKGEKKLKLMEAEQGETCNSLNILHAALCEEEFQVFDEEAIFDIIFQHIPKVEQATGLILQKGGLYDLNVIEFAIGELKSENDYVEESGEEDNDKNKDKKKYQQQFSIENQKSENDFIKKNHDEVQNENKDVNTRVDGKVDENIDGDTEEYDDESDDEFEDEYKEPYGWIPGLDGLLKAFYKRYKSFRTLGLTDEGIKEMQSHFCSKAEGVCFNDSHVRYIKALVQKIQDEES